MRFNLNHTYDVYVYDSNETILIHLSDSYASKEDMIWQVKSTIWVGDPNADIYMICVSKRGSNEYAEYDQFGKPFKF